MKKSSIPSICTALLVAVAATTAQGQQCMLFDGWWNMDIHFEYAASSARSQSQNQERLDRLMKITRKAQTNPCCPHLDWYVNSHTDPAEVPQKAQAGLSAARAEYVAELLSKAGVPKPDICVRSNGATQPVVKAGDPMNARVEIRVQCEAQRSTPFKKC